MNNITDFIDLLKCVDEEITPEIIFKKVKSSDKLLKNLCECAFKSYEEIEKIKSILNGR